MEKLPWQRYLASSQTSAAKFHCLWSYVQVRPFFPPLPWLRAGMLSRLILDVKDPLCVDLLLRFDRGAPADWFHLGLPCGTCSRARERPLPGNQGARPLRGPDDLFGFADLKPFEAAQVAASNAVYKACVRILFRAYETGALIAIENPVRSWLWPLLAVLVKSQGSKAFSDWFFSLQDYDFDACMFGSRRAKATRIKGSPGVFDGLQISCDNSHPHLSWKPVRVSGRWVYPTKEEAEYTPELCHFLCVQASAAVSSPLASRPSSSRAKMLRAAVRASAGHQTRSVPPLIQEFKCTMRIEAVTSKSSPQLIPLSRGKKLIHQQCQRLPRQRYRLRILEARPSQEPQCIRAR